MVAMQGVGSRLRGNDVGGCGNDVDGVGVTLRRRVVRRGGWLSDAASRACVN